MPGKCSTSAEFDNTRLRGLSPVTIVIDVQVIQYHLRRNVRYDQLRVGPITSICRCVLIAQ
jgi:hypothetical protein